MTRRHRRNQQAAALAQAIAGKIVRCEPSGRDRYNRILARCFVGDTDLNGWLARRGCAIAYWRYSWRYAFAELMARFDGVGLWRGDFDRPEDWRRSWRR